MSLSLDENHPSRVFFRERTDLYGKMFHRKSDDSIAMTFSMTLLHEAGGPERFLAEWEEDPNDR